MQKIVLLTIVLLPVACRPDTAGRERALPDTAAPPYSIETLPPDSPAAPIPPRPIPARAEVLLDSVRIEGAWQPERLTLVRSPRGFEPPFTTYVPNGLVVEFAPADTAASVRFVAAFAGHRNPEAYLQLRAYPPGSSELLVRSMVDAFLRERDPREQSVRASEGWPWTIGAWDFVYAQGPANTHLMGTIGIARHGNRFLHVLAHYPAEYGDGVGPRFHRILQEWRWEDDGTPLVR